MGAIVDPSQRKSVDAFVKKAREEGANVFQSCACIPETGCYYPPTLITNVQPVSTVVQEEVGVASVTWQSFEVLQCNLLLWWLSR